MRDMRPQSGQYLHKWGGVITVEAVSLYIQGCTKVNFEGKIENKKDDEPNILLSLNPL